MNKTDPFIISPFDYELSLLIAKERNITKLEAFRIFIASETYKMMENNDLRMWYFSPLAIYDMWENEIATGDPRNSLYIRGDEVIGR